MLDQQPRNRTTISYVKSKYSLWPYQIDSNNQGVQYLMLRNSCKKLGKVTSSGGRHIIRSRDCTVCPGICTECLTNILNHGIWRKIQHYAASL